MRPIRNFFIRKFETDAEEYSRARIILNFILTEVLVSAAFAITHHSFNFHIPRSLFVGYSILAFLSLFLLRMKVPLSVVAHIVIADLWCCFLAGAAFSGGIFSPAIPWLALMPIMANLLIHHRAAIVWTILSSLSICFFIYYFKNPEMLLHPLGEWRSLIANMGLVIVVFLFSYLFHRSKQRLLEKLKIKNEELVEKQLKLEEQNNLLKESKEEVDAANTALIGKVNEIVKRNEVLERYWHALLEISKSRPINFGSFEDAMRHIIKVAADCLHTHRVSIWRYNEERNTLQCLILYEAEENKYAIESELLGTNFPRYFEALRQKDVIPADDAETNKFTFEFKKDYLRPHHIVSMMDTPYFVDGELRGVLCCEHQNEQRHWYPEDIIFAQALSDIITLAYRASQRRNYEAHVRQHRKEIARMNQSLEERIRERTKVLEDQNKQLAEYAFINSHLLRGPLCRILGLINLIDHTEIKKKEKELINHLKLSGAELDDVIARINGAIEKGDHFNRIYLREM